MKIFMLYLIFFVACLFSVKVMADSFIPKPSVLEYHRQLEEIAEFGTR